jgi:hypothetical protein
MENNTIILALMALGIYLIYDSRKKRTRYRELLVKLEQEEREVARLREELQKVTQDQK